MNELELLEDADLRARRYVDGVDGQAVYPAADAIAALSRFDEPFPDRGKSSQDTVQLRRDVACCGGRRAHRDRLGSVCLVVYELPDRRRD